MAFEKNYQTGFTLPCTVYSTNYVLSFLKSSRHGDKSKSAERPTSVMKINGNIKRGKDE